MSEHSIGFCNECRERVPADYRFSDGKVWFRKFCPTCGTNESLISSDATAWHAKRGAVGGSYPTIPRPARSTATGAGLTTIRPCCFST